MTRLIIWSFIKHIWQIIATSKCVLQNAENWGLSTGFKTWINEANTFCNTLVDRIVPGIRENLDEEWTKLGFKDTEMTQGEAFHFFVIEAPEHVEKELPLNKAGLNVIFTNDQTPYRTRKVRILNGAHTSMVPVAYLYGIETVREAVEHEVMGKFINQTIFDEIIPTLDLPDAELQQFANDVLDRFKNPFIKHELISISLNSVSKFETRVLPSILEFKNRKGVLPTALVFSMAALIHFYKGEYDGKIIPLNDDAAAIDFLKKKWSNCNGSEAAIQALASNILKWEDAWKMDLTIIEGLETALSTHLYAIEKNGMRVAVDALME